MAGITVYRMDVGDVSEFDAIPVTIYYNNTTATVPPYKTALISWNSEAALEEALEDWATGNGDVISNL